jgi:hypothetical protein
MFLRETVPPLLQCNCISRYGQLWHLVNLVTEDVKKKVVKINLKVSMCPRCEPPWKRSTWVREEAAPTKKSSSSNSILHSSDYCFHFPWQTASWHSSWILTINVLFTWLKSHGWKYCSLICGERKILFVGWKSTTYKTTNRASPM